MSSRKLTKNDSLKWLLYEEMRHLYHEENQLVKALPKMAKTSHNSGLKNGFEEHLTRTEGHVRRSIQWPRRREPNPARQCSD
jgi:ferritin-like metal-binding protein YciE